MYILVSMFVSVSTVIPFDFVRYVCGFFFIISWHRNVQCINVSIYILIIIHVSILLFCRQRIDHIKEKTCVLNLLFGVPNYQTDGSNCQFGLSKKSLTFQSQQCGIFFSNLKWKDKQVVHITGNPDNVVNFDDRIAAIRLYSDANKVTTDTPELDLWKGIILPDIMVCIRITVFLSN